MREEGQIGMRKTRKSRKRIGKRRGRRRRERGGWRRGRKDLGVEDDGALEPGVKTFDVELEGILKDIGEEKEGVVVDPGEEGDEALALNDGGVGEGRRRGRGGEVVLGLLGDEGVAVVLEEHELQ